MIIGILPLKTSTKRIQAHEGEVQGMAAHTSGKYFFSVRISAVIRISEFCHLTVKLDFETVGVQRRGKREKKKQIKKKKKKPQTN